MSEVVDASYEIPLIQPMWPFFKSPEIDKLATALAKAQGEMKAAAKDSVNPHFKNKYADLAAVWDACREPLAKNGLCVVQMPRAEGRKVTIVYAMLHSSGQYIGSDLALLAMKEDAQGVGGAITYGRRYTLAAVAGIAQDDDDGNTAAGVKSGKPEGPSGDFNPRSGPGSRPYERVKMDNAAPVYTGTPEQKRALFDEHLKPMKVEEHLCKAVHERMIEKKARLLHNDIADAIGYVRFHAASKGAPSEPKENLDAMKNGGA